MTRQRKPIARSKAPIKRGKRPKARRSTPRRSGRVRDVPWMLAVKELPCRARRLSACDGPVEADHEGRRGLGQKCSDRETAPLCKLHHLQRETFSGPFSNWHHDEMRAWLDENIRETQATVGLRFALRQPDNDSGGFVL